MSINKTKACTFTGHRPEKLEGYSEKQVISWLSKQIDEAISCGYTDFITGMQRGVDLWVAEIVLQKKEQNENLRLFAAFAFSGMENGWDKSWIDRFNKVMQKADGHYYIGKSPSRRAFLKRNEWMVDHASRLIAVYTGARGGTLRTIEYAEKNELEIFMIDESKYRGAK